MSLHEMALSKTPSTSHRLSGQRLEYFHKCFKSTESWLSIFVNTPPSTRLWGISTICFAQVSRFLVVLLKLSTYDDPVWDPALVRSKMDFPTVLDRMGNSMRNISSYLGETSETDLFVQFENFCRSTRLRYAATFGSNPIQTLAESTEGLAKLDEIDLGSFDDFLNDLNWSNVVGSAATFPWE
jgi:hypothetical protein